MSTTPVLGIPYISGQQAQPEITHNEAILLLQTLTVSVLSRGVDSPPGSPSEGDAYIIGSSPTGAWAGRANCIAVFFGTAWLFLPGNDDNGDPITMGDGQEGMRAWVRDEAIFVIWRPVGSPPAPAWTALPFGNANTVGYDNGASGLAGTDVQAALDELAAVRAAQEPIVEAGAALTLSAAHNGQVINFTSGSAVTVTLPEVATEELPAGFVCTLIRAGDGAVGLQTEGSDTYLAVAVGSPPAPGATLASKGAAAVVTLLSRTGSPPVQLWHA